LDPLLALPHGAEAIPKGCSSAHVFEPDYLARIAVDERVGTRLIFIAMIAANAAKHSFWNDPISGHRQVQNASASTRPSGIIGKRCQPGGEVSTLDCDFGLTPRYGVNGPLTAAFMPCFDTLVGSWRKEWHRYGRARSRTGKG
jgi:hypothetical protein